MHYGLAFINKGKGLGVFWLELGTALLGTDMHLGRLRRDDISWGYSEEESSCFAVQGRIHCWAWESKVLGAGKQRYMTHGWESGKSDSGVLFFSSICRVPCRIKRE